MKWFAGSINEAVATSKSKNAIFVVFIAGKDDTSAQVAQAIDSTEVSSRLEQEHFVAIRLESGSESYKFFAQIYHLVPIPSIFFIGENGTPLEIVAGSTSVVQLASKIDNVLMKAGKNDKDRSLNLIDTEQEAASSSYKHIDTEEVTSNVNKVQSNVNTDLIASESNVLHAPSDKQNITENTKLAIVSQNAENKESTETLSENIDEAAQETNNTELTAEEKVERARQLIEVQRKQRTEDEKKKDKEREIQRRKTGQNLQKLRQMQQDLEIQQAYEERKREKAADAAAREKVRQQIAQDKLERKQKQLELEARQRQELSCQEQSNSNPNPVPSNGIVRIQFRLPSGSSHMGQFGPSNTLRVLRTYVVENIDLPFSHFAMSTSFPRRELTNEENDKTLLELKLVPTAVILILPLKEGVKPESNTAKVTGHTVTPAQNEGILSRFMWSLFMPVIGIYNYILNYFTGTNRNADRPRNSDNNPVGATGNIDRTMSSNAASGLFTRYLGNRGGTTVRAHGNIHRLHTDGDDNDENNTWNGNSTQQM